jgi:hypothetical protein
MSIFRRPPRGVPQINGEPRGPDAPAMISVAAPGTVEDKVAIDLPGPSRGGVTPLDQRSYIVGDRGDGPQAFQVKVGAVAVGDGVSAAQAVCDGFVARQLAAHPQIAAEAGFSEIVWAFFPGEDGAAGPDPQMLDLLEANQIPYQLYL